MRRRVDNLAGLRVNRHAVDDDGFTRAVIVRLDLQPRRLVAERAQPRFIGPSERFQA